MFRNYLAAALRNLVRNRLYAGINIIGLAIGFAAALLIALFLHDETSYDTWVSGYEQVYHISLRTTPPGQGTLQFNRTNTGLAALLKEQFPEIQSVARITNWRATGDAAVAPVLRQGDVEAVEDLFWADPDFFTVAPVPVVAGDLKAALADPSGIVLTRRLARKYFGTDTPIGKVIEINRRFPMTVMAVIEDLPSASHFSFTAVASARAPFSPLALFDSGALSPRNYEVAYTYFRLAPDAGITAMRARLPTLAGHPEVRHDPALPDVYFVERLDEAHLAPTAMDSMKPSGSREAVYTMAVVALLILAVACINFINLMTVRGMRRAIEVGIRKMSGAERRDLILQFIGEALIYAVVGAVFAIGLVFLVLPEFNTFLDRNIAAANLGNPRLAAMLAGMIVAAGFGAGVYPAFVLSAAGPGKALHLGKRQKMGGGNVQYGLVAFQFAVLLGLMVACGVIWRQTVYATTEGTRFNGDAMVVVEGGGCTEAFRNEVDALPGLKGTACSLGAPLNRFSGTLAERSDRENVLVAYEPVDFGLLELYGLQPLAGRGFSPSRGGDAFPDVSDPDPAFIPRVVLNETAVRMLGLGSPEHAVGMSIAWRKSPQPAEVIGVVPDFPFGSVREAAPPALFVIEPRLFRRIAGDTKLNIKLSGSAVPETLAAIDRIWRAKGAPHPIARSFLDERLQRIYTDVTRQAQVFAAFAATAMFIACLGLFGLAAFSAERRTKEIGIRKAMGASRADIVRAMIWDFTKPVLWANVIAWPLGYFTMQRWLEGFAYHIDLAPWIFLAASAVALVIAVATVAGHALLVARAEPVAALRYE